MTFNNNAHYVTSAWFRLIIDKPERKLKKGSGFHMDIVIMSTVNAMCGLFGAPWQCVATVRSVSHVSALTIMSTTHAPGDKPHIVEVKGTKAYLYPLHKYCAGR